MKIHDLKPAPGSKRPKRRVARGIGGKGGKTAGRGSTGQHARSTVPARFEPNALRVTADFSAFDPLLDAIAFSRGRLVVTMAGGVPLVAPAWPEAARTIEDCRI